MGRIARSWELTKQSYRVLMQDKELLVLPVISGACLLVVCAAFVFGLGLQQEAALEQDRLGSWLGLLAMYVVGYTIAFFFQAALVAGASQRLAGGDPTLGSALRAASARLPAIVLWGVVAGTVGMLLRALQERSGLVGRIVIGLVGIGWSLATFFMVPVLVMEQEPLGASFRRSANLFKKTWGETMVGSGGLGLISVLVMLPVVLLGFLIGAAVSPVLGLLLAVPASALVGVFFSALQGVYLASLYRYATTGGTAAGYDPQLLAGAFQAKKPRR